MALIRFFSREPTVEDCWRGIVLFGRNVASYKFALAKALCDLGSGDGDLVTLNQLAGPFSKHICSHLMSASKQGTFAKSKFLDGCQKANEGELTADALIDHTIRHGFNNVIDAFHIVGQGEVPHKFFLDERSSNQGIRVTENLGRLFSGSQAGNLPSEVESRWRLVETAWELGISRNLVIIQHDLETEGLFSVDQKRRRKAVTSSRSALNGYQKGKCFYCSENISLGGGDLPHVDHFFPHCLIVTELGSRINGVWNLVLACRRCNGEKSDRVPSIKLLERLHHRNEFLIGSHHPLRETIIAQTGKSPDERAAFLQNFHLSAHAALLQTWDPQESFPGVL